MSESELNLTTPPSPPATEPVDSTAESVPPTRKQQIESQIGDRVVGMCPEWARTLMRHGVILKLQIHRWRPYTRIDAEDLGISDTDPAYREFIEQYVTLGRKKLLPPEIINAVERCESAARETLRRYSYDTLWGRFVPVTAYRRLKAELERLRIQYFDLCGNLVDNLADYRAEMRRSYRVAGHKVWAQMHGEPESDETKARAEQFVTDFCDRVLSRIPDSETIRRSFLFEFTAYHIPLPSEFEQELYAEVQARDTRDMEAQRRRLMADMNREVADHYHKKKTEMIDGFINAVVGQMGSLIHEVAVNVEASIARNDGRLVGRSTIQLRHLIERVEALNFYDDARIETEIESIKSQLNRAADDRDIVEIGETLRRIRDIAAQDLVALNEPTRTRRSDLETNHVTVEPLRRGCRPQVLVQELPLGMTAERQTRRRPVEDAIVTAA